MKNYGDRGSKLKHSTEFTIYPENLNNQKKPWKAPKLLVNNTHSIQGGFDVIPELDGSQ